VLRLLETFTKSLKCTESLMYIYRYWIIKSTSSGAS